MEPISLKDYYNKMVQVQLSLHINESLEDEIFHHLRNGVLVLCAYMRMVRHPNRAREKEFLLQTSKITDQIRTQVDDMLRSVREDETRLGVKMLPLTRIIEKPELMTKEAFEAISAYNDELMTVSDEFRTIRKYAEIEVLKASGLVEPDFDIAADRKLNRYYQKLVEVQLSVKTALALNDEMTKYFGMTQEAINLMAPITTETMRLNVLALRLLDLTVIKPEMVTPQNFVELSAFNDRLRSVSRSFREIHMQAEIAMLKERELVHPSFTL